MAVSLERQLHDQILDRCLEGLPQTAIDSIKSYILSLRVNDNELHIFYSDKLPDDLLEIVAGFAVTGYIHRYGSVEGVRFYRVGHIEPSSVVKDDAYKNATTENDTTSTEGRTEARQRIDDYLAKQRENGYKRGYAWEKIRSDYENGECDLTRDDLIYLAQQLSYQPGWVNYKLRELGI